jgi:hypothetical protein
MLSAYFPAMVIIFISLFMDSFWRKRINLQD